MVSQQYTQICLHIVGSYNPAHHQKMFGNTFADLKQCLHTDFPFVALGWDLGIRKYLGNMGGANTHIWEPEHGWLQGKKDMHEVLKIIIGSGRPYPKRVSTRGGGQFYVSREAIQANPQQMYQDLKSEMEKPGQKCYAMEFLWPYLFHAPADYATHGGLNPGPARASPGANEGLVGDCWRFKGGCWYAPTRDEVKKIDCTNADPVKIVGHVYNTKS